MSGQNHQHSEQRREEHNRVSAPTTPGAAEGSPQPEQQSQTSPVPTQPETAEAGAMSESS
jgi:hypothetical protein